MRLPRWFVWCSKDKVTILYARALFRRSVERPSGTNRLVKSRMPKKKKSVGMIEIPEGVLLLVFRPTVRGTIYMIRSFAE